jgi:hypothetical protein
MLLHFRDVAISSNNNHLIAAIPGVAGKYSCVSGIPAIPGVAGKYSCISSIPAIHGREKRRPAFAGRRFDVARIVLKLTGSRQT